MSLRWIDSHCHLDAPEFDPDRTAVIQNAQSHGVAWSVMPAVQAKDFLKIYPCVQIVESGLSSAGLPCLWFDVVKMCRLTRQLVAPDVVHLKDTVRMALRQLC